MQRFYNTSHPQHEAIRSAMSELINGHQGLSSACLQCSPAVHFQPWWLHTTSSLHTFFPILYFVDVMLHPDIAFSSLYLIVVRVILWGDSGTGGRGVVK